MVKLASNWSFSIDRGPDWLFVKVQPATDDLTDDAELVENLWTILSKHFTYRLVLEMDNVEHLPSRLVDELIRLRQRIQQQGGMLRLCGLSEDCRKELDACHLHGGLPNYKTRTDAVLGHQGPVDAQLNRPA